MCAQCVSVPSVLSKVYCFFHCLRPVSCVPNVVSVPSVLSQVHCFFIVFVLCRVCPMLSVSLLFCLRFIVFFYCLRPVSCVPNVVSVPSVLSKVYCFFHCLRPVSCVPNVVSVPSVLSKVYCFFNCLRPVSCVPNVASVPSVLSKVYCFFY